MEKKKLIYFLVSMFIVVCAKLMPGIGAISADGITAIGLVIGMVVLIATQAVPTGFMAFLCIVLQPILGLTSNLAETAANFTSYLFFFVILAFTIGIAFQNTSLIKRTLSFLLKKFKNDGRGPIMAIWLTTALLSGIVANFAILALMVAFCWEYLSIFKDEKDKHKVGACLLIGLCASTELGGNITPLGSSINMLIISYASQYGYDITFIKWVIVSLPLFIILFFLMTRILFWIFKPSAVPDDELQEYISSCETHEKLTKREILLITILSAMIILFICSPLISGIQTELLVCVVGVLMIFPGFGLATYDQLAKSEAFTQTIYICCFIGLASILSKTGVVTVMADAFAKALPLNPPIGLVVGALCIIVIFLCNFLPAAAVPSVLAIPMLLLAESYGFNPAYLLIPLAMCSNCSWILPLDPIALLTFGRGYYTVGDMIKAGLVLTAVTAVITGGWISVISMIS